MPTPLEQFNEEVISEFCKIYTPVYLDLEASIAENLDVNLRNLITQKLTEHKELILGMVREKAPKLRIVGYQTYCLTCNGHLAAGECDCVGFNQGVQEFLNNLDTI